MNVLSNEINFRTSSDRDQTTQHHGELELDADANTVGTVVDANNTSTSYSDGIAVKGTSVPRPYYGIGGKFTGGYHGVEGWSTESGTGYRVGGYFGGENGDDGNYGLIAQASGPSGSTNYAGYFDGDIYVTGSVLPSDATLKLNEKKLDKALATLMDLEPKTYEYDTASHPMMHLPRGEQVGLIAQEVEKVLPALVKDVTVPPTSKDPADEPETFKGLNYTGLIPVLVGAIKEQQATIEGLRKRVEQLENRGRW